jgi:hypothetical protein
MYGYVYSSIANADSFQGGSSVAGSMVAGFMAVAVIIAIQLLIVQYLWNNVLVRCVSVVRPLKTLLETLGLLILFAFLMPGCVA